MLPATQSSEQTRTHETPWPLLPMAAGGLIALGLARRSLLGVVSATIGGALLYRSFCESEHAPASISTGAWLGRPNEKAGQPPAIQTPPIRQFGFPVYSGGDHPEPCDQVDEASMESFPASDPPAYSTSRS